MMVFIVMVPVREGVVWAEAADGSPAATVTIKPPSRTSRRDASPRETVSSFIDSILRLYWMSAERDFGRGGCSPEQSLGQRKENGSILSTNLLNGGICHVMLRSRRITLGDRKVVQDAVAWAMRWFEKFAVA
jgi:hypothetical protein